METSQQCQLSMRLGEKKPIVHTDQEWSFIQPHLIKMYRDEGRTLKHTMRVMEMRFGFVATYVALCTSVHKH